MPDSLLMFDGFAHYTVAQATTKWQNYLGTVISGVPTGTGYALSEGFASTTLPGDYTLVASAIKTLVASGPRQLIKYTNPFADGTDVTLNVISDGRLRLDLFCGAGSLGSGGPQVYSTPFAIPFGGVYQFQLQVEGIPTAVAPSFYSVVWNYNVLVNGVSRLSGSASTPTGGANIAHFFFDQVQIFSNDGFGSWMGDFWCTDGELLGQCPILQFLVTADGGTITWTPLSGTNFSNVQDRIVNDSKYNFTPNIGDIDTYQYATVPAGTIKGVQFTIRLDKDSGGDATAKINYFDGTATTLTPGAEFAPSDSFAAFFRDPWRKSIYTGIDWTPSELNAMRVGPKRI